MSFSLPEFLSSGALISLSKDSLFLFQGASFRGKAPLLATPSLYQNEFFLRNRYPWISFPHVQKVSIDRLISLLGEGNPQEDKNDWSLLQEELYQKIVEDLLEKIHSGLLKKGVPYLFSGSSKVMTPSKLKRSLSFALNSLKKSGGFLYGVWEKEEGCLGITPELLFSHSINEPKKVFTVALAGTFRSPKKTFLLKNSKEEREHRYVVDGIKEAASSMGTLQEGKADLLSFGKICHIKTPLTLHLKDSFSFDKIVESLHPTPALGAFPLQAGKKWLASIDALMPRGNFGAPIGFYDPVEGQAACYVAIRNVEWNQTGMRIAAGGGVIEESLFENEREEIEWKMEAVKERLGL